ncbi:MAG TPA: diguanylate cyclase [Pseudomonadales bacterium]|nr:diguanylate cyclase [Pseudomonadales bacterium]
MNALQELEENPADVVLIESEMDEMSGIELAEAIREVDTDASHFTYLIVSGEAPPDDMRQTFAHSVDAWITPGNADALNAAVAAGLRISAMINALAEANRKMLEEREDLIKGQLLDPMTGLGNRRFAEQFLDDCLRQIESRGGCVCFLMIVVGNYEAVREKYDDTIAAEFMNAVARRIQNLVRPMDIVTYFAPGVFALVLLQPSIEQCTAECYQRIFDGVKLKSFKTSVGYIDPEAGMSIAASGAETGAPQVESMIAAAEDNLDAALGKQTIIVTHLNVE